MTATHQPSLNLATDTDPGYGQLFRTLMRRRFWLLGILAGTVGVAALLTLRQEPTYVSSMQLLVEPNYQGKKDKEKLQDEFADSNIEVDTATQLNLMKSSSLLQKAMVMLQPEYPEFDPESPADVNAFKNGLSVAQVAASSGSANSKANTKIFQVIYTSNDPIKTQKVLEAIQKVYLDYNLEQQRLRLAKGLSFIDEQLPKIEGKVKRSEDALERFRRGQEVINPEDQAKARAETLNRIQQDQQTNLAQIRDLQSRFANLQQKLALSPQEAIVASRISQSTRYQSLLNEIQKTELELAKERTRFKDGTDFVQQVLDRRRKQLGLLQEEVRRVLGESASRSGEQLLSQGQLNGLDLTLINQLVDAQVNLQAAQARYQSLAAAEQQLRADLKRFPRLLAEYGRLQPEVDLNRETYKELLKARQELGLEIARGGFDWQVVEEAQLGSKTGPNFMQNLMLGAVVGLFLGGAAAFGREAIDDAVYSSDDLKKQVPLPLLGMVPELSLEAAESPRLMLPFRKTEELTPSISQVIHWRPFRESLDLLYQNIQLLNSNGALKSLVVTSALAGEGKSTLILGLAISAARLHQRVLLIDADLRRPSLHKLLNLPNDRGLSSLLTSDAPVPTAIAAQDSNLRSNISVLTSGPTPADPAKLLSSQRMREVMATFEQTYDLVLLDAPPVLGMVDAMLAASCCSGVAMVGRIGQVTRTELTQATAMLSKLNVIGVIANGATSQTRGEVHYQQP